MRVDVRLPEIDGDTVWFRWEQDASDPYQSEHAFFYRYEGLDLARYSTELFYEIFLALQIRVFAAYEEPVELRFPTAVPRFTAAYWLAVYEAANVTVAPLAEQGGYDPWAGKPALVGEPRTAAVFFGGGKDSTLATCLLSEIYGPDEVVLIQFVGPLDYVPEQVREVEERQERLMLAPARRAFGVATQRGWTNYQSIFRPAGYHLRPHFQLYTAGALPALLAWGVRMCTFTAPWSVYTVSTRADGSTSYRYGMSRAETLAAQSRHYAATLGRRIDVTNVIMPFPMLAAHWLLAERYPAALDTIVSCTRGGSTQRWCLRCHKCMLFAMFCLATNIMVDDFDYDEALREAHVIRHVIADAESGAEPGWFGNGRYFPGFYSGPRAFVQACHMTARIEQRELPMRLGLEARANLALVQAVYGNQLFPEWECIARTPLEGLGPELGPKITAIVAEHFPIIDHLPGPNLHGDTPCRYDFTPHLPAALAALEHIREAPAHDTRAAAPARTGDRDEQLVRTPG